LAGTLTTVSQPNITTLAGVTSIGTSSNVAVLNSLSVGTASPVAGKQLFVSNASHCESWINAGSTSLANLVFSKANTATWQNYVNNNEGSTPAIRWYHNLSDVMTLTTGGLLTVTSLAGTLTTVSQPNITSLGTLTGLTTSGPILLPAGSMSAPSITWAAETNSGMYRSATNNISMVIGGSLIATWLAGGLYMNYTGLNGVSDFSAVNAYMSGAGCFGSVTPSANIRLSVFGASTDLAALYLVNPISKTGTSLYGCLHNNTFTTSSNSYFAADIFSQSTFNSINGMLFAAGVYMSHTISNSGTIANYYGIISGATTAASATITNAYSGYFSAPDCGTNRFALYAANLAVGSTTVPPTNGIFSAGHVKLGSSCNLAVNNTTPATTIGLTSNLPICAGSGSASGPGYAFFADNAAGMYYTTNALNFSTQSIQRLLIDVSGITIKTGALNNDAGTSSGGTNHILLRTAGSSVRWGVGLQNTESSSNAGSDFQIYNYSDAGSYLSNPLTIKRSNNKTTIAGPVSLSTVTDNTNGNITAGTYTPTYTTTVGTISSAIPVKYMRIGNRVHVAGRCSVNTSGPTSGFSWTMTLPFSRTSGNFSSAGDQAAGTATISGSGDVYTAQCLTASGTQTISCICSFNHNINTSVAFDFSFIYED